MTKNYGWISMTIAHARHTTEAKTPKNIQKPHQNTHSVHVLLHFVFFKSVTLFDFFPSTLGFFPHNKNPSLGKFRQVPGSIDGFTFAKGEGRTGISCGFGGAQGELGST